MPIRPSVKSMQFATAGLFVAALVCVWLAYNGGTYTIAITDQEAQERIIAALEKRAAGDHKPVSVESVHVFFIDNQIRIDAKISGLVKGRAVWADIHAVGRPEYRGGAFYFHPTAPIRFKNVKVEKAEKKEQFFGRTKELLGKKIEQFAAEHGWEDVTETFKAEFQDWATATAQKAIATGLSRHPIYTLKGDMKGFAIKAVLEKVEVVGDKLNITLSLVQFGYTIFISAVCVVLMIGLLFVLIAII